MGASVIMSSNSNHVEMMKEKRNMRLAVLMVPVIGMANSILIIF
jgi:hypothetical protein